jgi:DNA-directed RNA polymerase specialized sigma24 family protein
MQASRDPRTDGELLVATGTDPEAFAIFYRRHVRGVLSFFRRRTPTAEVAFDLTAETFAAALEAIPRYQLRAEPARGWLYGIAWNKLHEAHRRGRAEDTARRALGMAPVTLTDAGLARIESVAGGPALERWRACRQPSATRSAPMSSKTAPTVRSPPSWPARRVSCASGSVAGCER